MWKVNRPLRCNLLSIGVLVMGCGVFSASATHSKAVSNSAIDATFSGELIDIPCKFMNTADLDFDFKDVITQEIDEKSHFIDKSLQITCDKDSPKKLLTVRLAGTPLAGAAKNVLDGGLPHLGIAMTSADSGKAFDFDTPITEGASGNVMTLNLRATLINNSPDTPVATGDFSTELTLSASFE